jgi:chemotaxis receptor (MCP) glutamine deamidase CheD
MLLNGAPLNSNKFETVLEALRRLPSGFESRNMRSNTVVYTDVTAGLLNSEGIAAYNKKDWKTASAAFNKAAAKSAQCGDKPAEANSLSNEGAIKNMTGAGLEAKKVLEQAIAIHQELGHYDHLFRDAGVLHEVLQNIAKKQERGVLYKIFNNAPEKQEVDRIEIQAALADIRKTALFAMKHSRLLPVNPDAIRVEQNEIGFSADRPIGTDNICSCVCVVIHDPLSKKTALAHVDSGSDIQSLQEIFDRMPKNVRLEARLVGACYGDQVKMTAEQAEVSIANMKKITAFINGKNVNILSSDIFDAEQPRAIVVDPLSFKITEAIPDLHNPDEYIATSLSGYSGDKMHIAFDLTQSSERAPHLVTFRKRYALKQSEAEICQGMEDCVSYKSQIPAAIEQALLGKKGYQAATDHLIAAIDRQVEKKLGEGLPIDSAYRNLAVQQIMDMTIHVGENAAQFNRPLMDFIENNLFYQGYGGMMTVDVKGLSDITFAEQPYTVIEKNLQEKTNKPAHKKEMSPA